ncbi:MAG: DUF2079 domain-containing protein [Candidatus Curtissbacteria bacterium]|nr:DUF2079 domain-containing protein [Candidatus Curtissbacteria bacterium]
MLQKRSSDLKKIGGVSRDFWVIVAFFLIFSTLYSLLAVIRHNHFQSQGIDFSIYDQALWLYSKFQSPFSTVTFLFDLADRFRPIMIPLSTLYWFTDNERVILIFQAVILSAAVFPIWLMARRVLPNVLALVIAFSYLNFVGIQSVNVYDFHEMAMLPFALAWLFFFLEKRRWRSFLAALILCLTVRENVGFLISTIGIYVWIRTKNIKTALATVIIPLAWSMTAIGVVMPALGQSHYGSFVQTNDTLPGAIFEYLKNPLLALGSFLFPIEKISTVFWSFLSFGFIPLSFLPLAPAILFQFASRFLDLMHPIRWTLYYHYGAELGVLMSVSAIFGARMLLARFPKRSAAAIIIALIIFGQAMSFGLLHAPLKNLLKKNFYQDEPWTADTRKILSLVPKDASLASQNNLLPHVSHRKFIYLLPNFHSADYIVFDLHPGQNNWNFYNGNLQTATRQFRELVDGNIYKLVAASGDVYLLKKN